MFKKKAPEHVCKNCKLYDPSQGVCRVVILFEGERINIPVEQDDKCFFEQKFVDPETRKVEDFNEIKEVRFWVENEQGEKTDQKGTVKIEYPEGFFGDLTLRDILG